MRDALRSSDPAEVFDALIGIGRAGLVALRPEVEHFLAHPEPRLRSAAIRVLAFYWALEAHRQTAEQMWRGDPSEDVRAVALMAWGRLYDGSKDAAALTSLISLLNDLMAGEAVRAQAWASLLSVAGIPQAQWPTQVAVYGRVDALVDWSLVYKIEAMLA